MTQTLWEMVKDYRKVGISISDKEAESIFDFCIRKMERVKIKNREEYLPLLYADELKNYLVRTAVNATSLLMMYGKEARSNV